MRKIISAFVFGLLTLAANAFAAPVFEPVGKTTHDFGNVSSGDAVEYTFQFRNSGTDTLVIESVKGS